MALDEWVYLIATDVTNASYLLPVSFWGGVVAVGLACLWGALLVLVRLRRSASSGDSLSPWPYLTGTPVRRQTQRSRTCEALLDYQDSYRLAF